MAIIALQSASSGLSALSTSLDVIANNLANANTEGFKSSRSNFQDLFYAERAQPGVQNANGEQRPTGLFVGLGTKISGTQLNFDQGPAQSTGKQLDLMIEGDGFFQVEVDKDLSEGGIAYTRAGNFVTNSQGDIVLATDQGRRIIPNINVPLGTTSISIGADGTVSAIVAGNSTPQQLQTIQLATFINPAGLKQLGENLYAPSAASGEAVVGDPEKENRGSIRQGFLEGSNVDPVIELVSLIKTQRDFELNSQSIQAADQALQTIGRLRQF